MLLLSLLNFLSGNLRQAVANPLRQGAVVEFGRAFPQRSFFLVVFQIVFQSLFHGWVNCTHNRYPLTDDGRCVYNLHPRTASSARCQDNRFNRETGLTLCGMCRTRKGFFAHGGEA